MEILKIQIHNTNYLVMFKGNDLITGNIIAFLVSFYYILTRLSYHSNSKYDLNEPSNFTFVTLCVYPRLYNRPFHYVCVSM